MRFIKNDGNNNDKPMKRTTGAEYKNAVENSHYLRKISGELLEAM